MLRLLLTPCNRVYNDRWDDGSTRVIKPYANLFIFIYGRLPHLPFCYGFFMVRQYVHITRKLNK